MNYDCTLAPADKLAFDATGVKMPLCNDCTAPDCTNPIRNQTVSVMGVPQQMRLYVVRNVVKQVVACKGYVGEVDASLSAIKESLEDTPAPIRFNDTESQPDN